jgi:hypothetical protein
MYPEFSSWLSYQTILHPNHARFVLSLAENAGGKCHDSEFYLAEVRWLKLDMPSIRGRGTLLDKVDLSKVDAVGFADLTPGSGHGLGGFADVAWIEVYGEPVKRDTPSKSN